MTIAEAKEWLTDERLAWINHDRERAGEEPASREMIARLIASLKGSDLLDIQAALRRYEGGE